jgi:predicted house-cleaning noncanonical NTP pyrophosphatase (MazG superfamily)
VILSAHAQRSARLVPGGFFIYTMNIEQHLLIKLSEECVEIAKDADTALLFGLYDIYFDAPGKLTCQDKIVNELNDLMGVVSMLVEIKVLPKNWMCDAKMGAKRAKVLRCMKYAQQAGVLGAFELTKFKKVNNKSATYE